MNIKLALIALVGLQVTMLVADTSILNTYPAVDSHSWKTTPGGINFISSLHTVSNNAKKQNAVINDDWDSDDINLLPKQTILQQAVDNDNPSFLQLLLNNKNDIQVKDETGQSLLHLTLGNENTKQLRILLDAGLDPNLGDNVGITPLHTFLNLILEKPKRKQFAQDAIALLVSRGANIHATGKFGVSPWHMVNWKKDGSLIFGADTLKIFITAVTPQEAQYVKKGPQEKERLIQSKLSAAKEFLPLFSPRKDALKTEIEKNLTNAITQSNN